MFIILQKLVFDVPTEKQDVTAIETNDLPTVQPTTASGTVVVAGTTAPVTTTVPFVTQTTLPDNSQESGEKRKSVDEIDSTKTFVSETAENRMEDGSCSISGEGALGAGVSSGVHGVGSTPSDSVEKSDSQQLPTTHEQQNITKNVTRPKNGVQTSNVTQPSNVSPPTNIVQAPNATQAPNAPQSTNTIQSSNATNVPQTMNVTQTTNVAQATSVTQSANVASKTAATYANVVAQDVKKDESHTNDHALTTTQSAHTTPATQSQRVATNSAAVTMSNQINKVSPPIFVGNVPSQQPTQPTQPVQGATTVNTLPQPTGTNVMSSQQRTIDPQNSLDITSGQHSHENTVTLTRQQRNVMDFENLKQKLVQLSGSQKNVPERTDETKAAANFAIHQASTGVYSTHTMAMPATRTEAQITSSPAINATPSPGPQTGQFLPTQYSGQYSNLLTGGNLHGATHQYSAFNDHSVGLPLLNDHLMSPPFNSAPGDTGMLIQQLLGTLQSPPYHHPPYSYPTPHYPATQPTHSLSHQSLQQLQQLAALINQLQQQYPLLHSPLASLLNQQVYSVFNSQGVLNQGTTYGQAPRPHYLPSSYEPQPLIRHGRRIDAPRPQQLADLERALIEKLHMKRVPSYTAQLSHESLPSSPGATAPMQSMSPPQNHHHHHHAHHHSHSAHHSSQLSSQQQINSSHQQTLPAQVASVQSHVNKVEEHHQEEPVVETPVQSSMPSHTEVVSESSVESPAAMVSKLPVATSQKSRFSVTLVEDDPMPKSGRDASKMSRQSSLERPAKMSPTKTRLSSPTKSKAKEVREVTRKGRFQVTTVIKDTPSQNKTTKEADIVEKSVPDKTVEKTVVLERPSSAETKKSREKVVKTPVALSADVVHTSSITSSVMSTVSQSSVISTLSHKVKPLHPSDSVSSFFSPTRSTIPVAIKRRQSVPLLHLNENKISTQHNSLTPPLGSPVSACSNSFPSHSHRSMHDPTLCTLTEVCFLSTLLFRKHFSSFNC